ncbi:MAG TPA: hypothetical protein VHP54_05150 [Caproiciproducens sp.]|nr:hypothetical protein [Caproiciproducens sp.]
MTYVYAAMWFAVGLILIFRMGRENRIFYAAGAFFFLLGGWWLANAIFPGANLFAGIWGWVLRGITAVALVLMCVVFYRETQKEKSARGEEPHDDKN